MPVFHTTFDVALHCSGSPVSLDMPCLDGPRQNGQFSAEMVCARKRLVKTMTPLSFMSEFLTSHPWLTSGSRVFRLAQSRAAVHEGFGVRKGAVNVPHRRGRAG